MSEKLLKQKGSWLERLREFFKRRGWGALLIGVGFMLSPLSWWNDAFINLPLALGFAWLVSLFYKPAFAASLIVGYWLTNVLGFVLMHKGAQQLADGKKKLKRELLYDLLISVLYTELILLLLQLKILRPLQNYGF